VSNEVNFAGELGSSQNLSPEPWEPAASGPSPGEPGLTHIVSMFFEIPDDAVPVIKKREDVFNSMDKNDRMSCEEAVGPQHPRRVLARAEKVLRDEKGREAREKLDHEA